MSSGPSAAWSGSDATPRLAVTSALTPGTASPSKLARSVSATCMAPSRSVSCSSTTNSSPPQRPAKSLARTPRRSVAPNGGEHLVARLMPVAVVERLEVVEVDHDGGQRACGRAAPGRPCGSAPPGPSARWAAWSGGRSPRGARRWRGCAGWRGPGRPATPPRRPARAHRLDRPLLDDEQGADDLAADDRRDAERAAAGAVAQLAGLQRGRVAACARTGRRGGSPGTSAAPRRSACRPGPGPRRGRCSPRASCRLRCG